MNHPTNASFTAVIKHEILGEGKNARMLFSSPDIPGFFLCYSDLELSYKLIEPVARCMIWNNLEKSVKLQSLDRQLLRDKGVAIATFVVTNEDPQPDPLLEEHGVVAQHDTEDGYVFLPRIMVKGKEFFHQDVVLRIMQKNGF